MDTDVSMHKSSHVIRARCQFLCDTTLTRDVPLMYMWEVTILLTKSHFPIHISIIFILSGRHRKKRHIAADFFIKLQED